MRKLFSLVFLLLIIFLTCFGTGYASSSSDESVLGNNRWSVDSSGNLIPIANASYTIGSSSYRPSSLYAGTVDFTGPVTFHSNLLATGIANGDSTSMSSATTAVPITYKYIRKDINSVEETDTLANGYPGQLLTIYVYHVWDSGTMTLVPATRLGYASLSFDAADDSATLLYLNDTLGWSIVSLTSVTRTGTK